MKYESNLDYLCHHGTKGQKWGTRRYQNKDGSLTELGYVHYGYGKRSTSTIAPSIKKKVTAVSDTWRAKKQEKIKKREEAALKKKNKIQADIDAKEAKINERIKKKEKALQDAARARYEAEVEENIRREKTRKKLLNPNNASDIRSIYANRKYLTNSELEGFSKRFSSEASIKSQMDKLDPPKPSKMDKTLKMVSDISKAAGTIKTTYDNCNKAVGILNDLGIIDFSMPSVGGNNRTNRNSNTNTNSNNQPRSTPTPSNNQSRSTTTSNNNQPRSTPTPSNNQSRGTNQPSRPTPVRSDQAGRVNTDDIVNNLMLWLR